MNAKYNRRKFLCYGAAAFSTSLLLKACANNPPTAILLPGGQATSPNGKVISGEGKGFKIAIVLPGMIADQGWNQIGYEGANQAKEKLGVETAYIENVGQTEQIEVLSDFARRGYNLVFAHGEQFDIAVQQVAVQFPKTFFVAVNGAVQGSNTASLQLDNLQASYVCGLIGALMTKSNQLAYLAAQSFQATNEELRGFELGAKSVKPDIQLRASYTGDWNDVAKAKAATLELISAGSDVIYPWLDNASLTVLQTASEKGVYAFGNTIDQLAIAPKAVLTGAVKRIDLAIAYLAELALKGEIQPKIYRLGLERKDIFYLGQFGDMVPKPIQAQAAQTVEAIITRKITFETCQIEGQYTRCVKKA